MLRRSIQSFLADFPPNYVVYNEFDEEDNDKKKRYTPRPVFDTVDRYLLGILTVLGFITRYWTLGHPKAVMFDEAHFVKFVSCYFTGEYFFDIHPPFAKLLMALIGNLGIMKGNHPIERYGGGYDDNFYFYLRITPAFFGAMLVPFSYACGRALHLTKFSALLGCFSFLLTLMTSSGTWFILIDNLLLIESRTAVTDAVLIFWVMASTFCAAMLYNQILFTREWFFWTIATGVSLGLAITVKLTAMAVIGLVGLWQVWDLFRRYIRPVLVNYFYGNQSDTSITQVFRRIKARNYKWIKFLLADGIVRAGLILSLMLLIHFICWHIHFKLLIYNGEGNPFMEPQFISNYLKPPPELPYHCYREPSKQLETFPPGAYPPLSTFQAMINIHYTIYVVNFGLRAQHPTASKWYTWPLMQCRVVPFYYGTEDGKQVKILSTGNMISWYLTAACVVIAGSICVLLLLIQSFGLVTTLKRRFNTRFNVIKDYYNVLKNHQLPLMVTFSGYFLNLVGFMIVPRITWIYHYQPALVNGFLLVGVCANATLAAPKSQRAKSIIFFFWLGWILAASAYYYYMIPWIYGRPLSDSEHLARKWRPEWY